MTKYLGIDYGRKHLGLAISDGVLASPLGCSRLPGLASARPRADKAQGSRVTEGLGKETLRIIDDIRPEEIIIGVSEGKMAKETREFGVLVKKETKLPVIFWDETLTTQEAVKKMVEGGMAKGRRRKMDHNIAAALILQSYLDQNGIKKT